MTSWISLSMTVLHGCQVRIKNNVLLQGFKILCFFCTVLYEKARAEHGDWSRRMKRTDKGGRGVRGRLGEWRGRPDNYKGELTENTKLRHSGEEPNCEWCRLIFWTYTAQPLCYVFLEWDFIYSSQSILFFIKCILLTPAIPFKAKFINTSYLPKMKWKWISGLLWSTCV